MGFTMEKCLNLWGIFIQALAGSFSAGGASEMGSLGVKSVSRTAHYSVDFDLYQVKYNNIKLLIIKL